MLDFIICLKLNITFSFDPLDSFKEGTHQNGEFDKSYKNHSLTKSGKKKHGRETNQGAEIFVSISYKINLFDLSLNFKSMTQRTF